VLQAVHLLLAYPLFVVVVGVDPRWLLHSLKGTHRAFRGNARRVAGDGDLWRTTPQNYLEKIFQIPFNLRPMTPEGYARLVEALLLPENGDSGSTNEANKGDLERVNVTEPGSGGSVPTPASSAGERTGAGGDGTAPNTLGTTATNLSAQTAEPASGKLEKRVGPQFVIYEESLAVKSWEASFAARLFTLIPTPRAAKRFTNVYRILKAPVPRERLPIFEGTPEWPGEFQLPMLLLAILIGAPAESAELFPKLWIAGASGRSATEVLRNLTGLPDRPSEELYVLQEKIRPIVGDAAFPGSADLMKEWLPRVSRFSFDVGRSVEAIRYTPGKSTVSTTA
jgi:hypothetical protein